MLLYNFEIVNTDSFKRVDIKQKKVMINLIDEEESINSINQFIEKIDLVNGRVDSIEMVDNDIITEDLIREYLCSIYKYKTMILMMGQKFEDKRWLIKNKIDINNKDDLYMKLTHIAKSLSSYMDYIISMIGIKFVIESYDSEMMSYYITLMNRSKQDLSDYTNNLMKLIKERI